MNKWLDKKIEETKSIFPKAFIYKNDELILEPKNNIYFRIDNIYTDLDFDCKVLGYVCRSAHKDTNKYWREWFKRGFNSYFRKNFSDEELRLIYTKLGNDCNRKLSEKFIKSGFDMDLLKNPTTQQGEL